MPAGSNRAWNLEAFLDSLIVELDKAQDTLSYKGITRKLTYTVRDVALDLQIFPQFDGKKVRFVTAQPGEAGSSKLSIQLGSISDRQIRESTKEPPSRDDITIDEIDGLDDDVKDSLRKVGITSAGDLERIETRNVNLENAVKQKTTRTREDGGRESDGEGGTGGMGGAGAGEGADSGTGPAAARPSIDYGSLANLIRQAKRKRQFSPRVLGVGLADIGGGGGPATRVLLLTGENLVLEKSGPPRGEAMAEGAGSEFPVAVLDGERVEVLGASEKDLRIAVPPHKLRDHPAILRVALDPYAVITMEIRP